MSAEREQLIQLRKDRGFSQAGFAKHLGMSRSTVADWESGKTTPKLDSRRHIATVLHVPVTRITELVEESGTPETALIAQEAEVLDVLPDRRDFFEVAAKAVIVGALTTSDLSKHEIANLATPLPSRVGVADAEKLTKLVDIYWRQEQQFGAGMVRDAVIAQLGRVEKLRSLQYSDDVGGSLAAAHADLSSLAGWSSHGVGLPGEGLKFLVKALGVSREAEDYRRMAECLQEIGRIHLDLNDYESAKKAFSLGIVAAEESGSHEFTAKLFSVRSRAYAFTGNAIQSKEMLKRAEDTSLLGSDEFPLTGMRNFEISDHASNVGRSNLILSGFDSSYASKGIEALSQHVQKVNKSPKWRASNFIDLATCYYRVGDLDAAVSAGQEMTILAQGIDAVGLTKHMDVLLMEAQKHVQHSDSIELIHQIKQLQSA